MTSRNEAAAEMRRLAEDTLIWQDEWNSPSSDGSAVQDWIDAASPQAVLDALAAERRETVELLAPYLSHEATCLGICECGYDEVVAPLLDEEAARA